MNASTLQASSTLNSNQSTMSCMGNPQAIIRKCVHPSMPHSNFYLLGNRAKIPKCNLQKKCCWFSQHFKSAKILCKGWQILYVFKLSFTFFMSNLLPQNLGTFFEIYRSATGLYDIQDNWESCFLNDCETSETEGRNGLAEICMSNLDSACPKT